MLTREGDTLKVSGPLTVDSVTALLAQSKSMMQDLAVVDLSGVSEADSAGISLLLEWRRQLPGRNLRFAHLPAPIKSLAELYGVADLIPH